MQCCGKVPSFKVSLLSIPSKPREGSLNAGLVNYMYIYQQRTLSLVDAILPLVIILLQVPLDTVNDIFI